MTTTQKHTPPTPGSVLKTHLRRPGNERITQDVLADALCVSRLSVNQLINDRRAVTADMAIRLSRVLGTSPEMWLALQTKADLHKAEHRLAVASPDLTVLRKGRANLSESAQT